MTVQQESNLRTSKSAFSPVRKNLRTTKQNIQQALNLKDLRGSIVLEKVACGKKCCSVCGGVRYEHGPYSYLHFYQGGKVKKKYLSKAVAAWLACPKKELEERLKELEQEPK